MDLSKIEPVGDRVLVENIEGDTKSKMGLELSDANGKELPIMGKVLAIGSESKFKVGDVLLFRRYAVDELKFNREGEETTIYLAEGVDVIGRIKPN